MSKRTESLAKPPPSAAAILARLQQQRSHMRKVLAAAGEPETLARLEAWLTQEIAETRVAIAYETITAAELQQAQTLEQGKQKAA